MMIARLRVEQLRAGDVLVDGLSHRRIRALTFCERHVGICFDDETSTRILRGTRVACERKAVAA